MGLVEGPCEHGNEPSGSIKCWEILECLPNWRLLKKASAPWSTLQWRSFHIKGSNSPTLGTSGLTSVLPSVTNVWLCRCRCRGTGRDSGVHPRATGCRGRAQQASSPAVCGLELCPRPVKHQLDPRG
jgi:hypothetical protein